MSSLRTKKKYWQFLAQAASNKITYEQDDLDKKASENFVFFCEHLTRNLPLDQQIKLKPHHLIWVEQLITNKDSKCLKGIAGDPINILAPRGAAKSTVLGLFAAWIIGYHAKHQMPLQILYISYNLDAAMAKSVAIKRIIESPEYQAIFPNVIKGANWADKKWNIDPHKAGLPVTGREYFTVMAAGITGTIASKRAHIVIYDDLIKNSDDIANIKIREKMIRNHTQAVKPTLFEGGRMISLGTRFRPDDIHAKEFLPDKGWKVLEQSALNPNDEGELQSYWESMWSTDFLKTEMERDPLSFSYQYQNKVMAIDGGVRIEPSWIHYGEPPTTFSRLAVGVDFAVSESTRACYTAMVIVGQSGQDYWILDYKRGKWIGNIEKIDLLLELIDDWKEPTTPCLVFAESVAYQASFKGDFVSYAINQKSRHDIQIVPSQMKGDKIAHLLSVTGIYANGLVKHNKYVDLSYPISEMTGFLVQEYTDCLDATVLALQGLGVRRRLSIR